jgi:hypothetical protein
MAIIIETLIFLYCFALIVFRIISFIVDKCLFRKKSMFRMPHYIRDCMTVSRMIPPNIMNTNIELKRIVCSHLLLYKIETGIQ